MLASITKAFCLLRLALKSLDESASASTEQCFTSRALARQVRRLCRNSTNNNVLIAIYNNTHYYIRNTFMLNAVCGIGPIFLNLVKLEALASKQF